MTLGFSLGDGLAEGLGNGLDAGTGVFSPLSFGAINWLNAEDVDSVNISSGTIFQWDDLTSFATNGVQGTVSEQPTYTTAGDGFREVTFDNIDDSLTFGNTGVLDLDAGVDEWTIVCVVGATSTRANFFGKIVADPNSTVYNVGQFNNESSTRAGGTLALSGTTTPAAPRILIQTCTTTVQKHYINKTLKVTAGIGTGDNSANTTMGFVSSTSDAIGGGVRGNVVIPSVLEQADIDTLVDFLAALHGITI